MEYQTYTSVQYKRGHLLEGTSLLVPPQGRGGTSSRFIVIQLLLVQLIVSVVVVPISEATFITHVTSY